LWIPAIGEPTDGNGFLIPSIFHRVLLTVLDEFLDHTGASGGGFQLHQNDQSAPRLFKKGIVSAIGIHL
jgi:hypothetical protein